METEIGIEVDSELEMEIAIEKERGKWGQAENDSRARFSGRSP